MQNQQNPQNRVPYGGQNRNNNQTNNKKEFCPSNKTPNQGGENKVPSQGSNKKQSPTNRNLNNSNDERSCR